MRKILVVFMQIVGNRENYDSSERLRNEKPIAGCIGNGHMRDECFVHGCRPDGGINALAICSGGVFCRVETT